MNRRRRRGRRSSANTKPRRESPSPSIIDEISSVSTMATSAKSTSSSSSLSLDMPWKTRVAISVLSRVTDYCRRPDGTVNRRLLGFLDLKSPPNPTPVNGVSSSDVPVDPSRDLWFRLYTPTAAAADSSTSLPVLVFFHGGGFSFLSPASKAYDAVCRRFARKLPAVVVSVNYRLTPEHRFPSQYDDCFDVLRFLDESSALPPIANVSKCFLAGDSAGGNIAHHMAVRACPSEKKLERVRVVGLVAIQPFFGGTERTESETRLEEAPLVSVRRTDWCWTAFLPEGEDRDHWAVNVSGPNAVDVAGLEGFPATLVFSAGFDPLRDWQKRYYEWLRRSGKEAELVDYPRMFHAFYIFPEVAQATELIMKVKDFIQKTIISLPNRE